MSDGLGCVRGARNALLVELAVALVLGLVYAVVKL